MIQEISQIHIKLKHQTKTNFYFTFPIARYYRSRVNEKGKQNREKSEKRREKFIFVVVARYVKYTLDGNAMKKKKISVLLCLWGSHQHNHKQNFFFW